MNKINAGHQKFNFDNAEMVINNITALSESVAILDGKLTNLDDKAIIDKIEVAMKGIASSDSQIRNTVYRIKDHVDYLEKIVKRDS